MCCSTYYVPVQQYRNTSIHDEYRVNVHRSGAENKIEWMVFVCIHILNSFLRKFGLRSRFVLEIPHDNINKATHMHVLRVIKRGVSKFLVRYNEDEDTKCMTSQCRRKPANSKIWLQYSHDQFEAQYNNVRITLPTGHS